MDHHCAVRADICEHADLAADQAVKKVFALLGVDVDDPESVESFREDLRFGKRLRRTTGKVGLAVLMAIGSGIGMQIWDALHGK